MSNYNLLLQEDPFALIESIPCSELEKWKTVANTPVPQTVIDRLEELEAGDPDIIDSFNPYDDWKIQELDDASGTVVNLDYFSVDVTLPGNLTPEFLLEHIRTTMLDDLEGATFTPHPNLFGEDNRWLYTPLGSILSISMDNDGSVICIQNSSSSWTFATISDPRNFTHPVSGNREFGFIPNGDGSYQFYTRGVDRIFAMPDAAVRDILDYSLEIDLMDLANPLWESFQENIKNYVTSIGGTAKVADNDHIRPDYNKLQEVLTGNLPVSEYDGCN